VTHLSADTPKYGARQRTDIHGVDVLTRIDKPKQRLIRERVPHMCDWASRQ
jgi:hypothetical protein